MRRINKERFLEPPGLFQIYKIILRKSKRNPNGRIKILNSHANEIGIIIFSQI
jgi:hypothetical protein